ncbi:MAG: zinc-dependent metalloprotease [Saprospiraceae bacterium]|nr:zinc-dependent metalloprotease [Saprospiraceae bacterium]MBP7699737.1 zinc-dependent metalloprotease [Saprospiraceae bacterium]
MALILGVLITNQSYTSSGGAVFGAIPTPQLEPTAVNKIGIIEAPFMGPIRYTFAHEIAHHFGCNHSQVQEGTLIGCPHGKNMLNGKNTILANGAPNYTRIQHFSNPFISFSGESTGNTGLRDNAAQIRGAFCEVANNNPVKTFCTQIFTDFVCPGYPFIAYTSSNEGWGTVGFWEQWCYGPLKFEWSWSLSPSFSNPTIIPVNNSVIELPSPPNCPKFYIRVTVTSSNGCTCSFTKLVYCNSLPCERNTTNSSSVDDNTIVPNPADDYIRFNVKDFGEIKTIAIIDAAGKIYNLPYSLNYDQTEISFDISELKSGLWFLMVQGSQKSKSSKFVIAR